MKDMQSEVKAPLVQAPIALMARRLLSSDQSVRAVMVLRNDGSVLAHEMAIDYGCESLDEQSYPLLYYASRAGLLFYLRLNKRPVANKVRHIEEMLESPRFEISP